MTDQLGMRSTDTASAQSNVSVPAPTKLVAAMVTAKIVDFHQTRIQADDGHQYAVVRRTAGIPWDQLQEGQRVRCVVTTNSFPRCVEVLEVL